MTTREMHVGIDLGLQKINSQITMNIRSEEKDWFLINEVEKYINQRTNKEADLKKRGFQGTAKRVDDVKDLIRTENILIEVDDRGKEFIRFPSNYLHYIRFDAYSVRECAITKSKATTQMYTAKIDLLFPTSTLAAYKIDLLAASTTTTLFDVDDLPSDYIVDLEFAKQKFLLIKAIKIKLEKKVREVLSPLASIYWENGNYDSITIESPVVFNSVTVIRTDEDSTDETPPLLTTSVNASTKEYKGYAIGDTPLKAKTRVVSEEFFTDVENSSISNSRPESPVSRVVLDTLELAKTPSVVFGSVDITYICKPNIIDLSLGSDLNMSTSVCREIVSNTVRYLKALLEDGNYQAFAQENVLIE